jgi:hypothetical protein
MWRNPWKRVRELEARVGYLERECEYLDRLASEAIGRACEHYEQRHRYEIARSSALHENLATIASMTPLSVRVPE